MKWEVDQRIYISPAVNNIEPITSDKITPVTPSKPTLHMGIVELSVQNLEKMTNFYQKIV